MKSFEITKDNRIIFIGFDYKYDVKGIITKCQLNTGYEVVFTSNGKEFLKRSFDKYGDLETWLFRNLGGIEYVAINAYYNSKSIWPIDDDCGINVWS